jgi:hypothetical protein
MILEKFLLYLGCGMMYFATYFLYWYFYEYEKPKKCSCTKSNWDGICDEDEIDSEFWNQYKLQVLAPIVQEKIKIEKKEKIIEIKKIVRLLNDNVRVNRNMDSLDAVQVASKSSRI